MNTVGNVWLRLGPFIINLLPQDAKCVTLTVTRENTKCAWTSVACLNDPAVPQILDSDLDCAVAHTLLAYICISVVLARRSGRSKQRRFSSAGG